MISKKSLLDQRRDARKRKKQHEKDAERGEGCADAQEMAEDDKLLSMPAPEKPQPPPEFDEEAVLAKVTNILNLDICNCHLFPCDIVP